MSGFNLPPGCRESDIPGNRPEDIGYEEGVNAVLLKLERRRDTLTQLGHHEKATAFAEVHQWLLENL